MNKGQATALIQWFLGLFTVGLIIALILLFISRWLDIHTIVYSNEVERHAINSANVLLSSKEVAHRDKHRTYRAVLRKDKLDEYFVKKENFDPSNPLSTVKVIQEKLEIIEALIKDGAIKEFAYPNSLVFGLIADLEDPTQKNAWFIVSRGSVMPEGFDITQTLMCLVQEINLDYDMIFRVPGIITGTPALSLWRWPSLEKCKANFASKMGVSAQGFPVGIMISKDEIHMGVMHIWLIEV